MSSIGSPTSWLKLHRCDAVLQIENFRYISFLCNSDFDLLVCKQVHVLIINEFNLNYLIENLNKYKCGYDRIFINNLCNYINETLIPY